MQFTNAWMIDIMKYRYMEQTVEHESIVDIPRTAIAVSVREEMVSWLEPVCKHCDNAVTNEELGTCDCCEKEEIEMIRRSSRPGPKFSGQKNRRRFL